METRRRIFLVINTAGGFTRGILASLARRAEQKRFVFDLYEGYSADVLSRMRSADGIIGYFSSEEQCERIRALAKPTVNLSNSPQQSSIPLVINDDEGIGAMAADYLLNKGFRHFVMIRSDLHYSKMRELGFARRLAAMGITPEIVIEPDSSSFRAKASTEWFERWKSTGKRPLAAFADRDRRPLAAFADRDRLALALLYIARDLKLAVPDDLAILGVDNDVTYCELTRPRLSSIQLAQDRIGLESMDLLERLMDGEPAPQNPFAAAPLGVVSRESTDVLAIDDPEVAATLRHIHERADQVINTKDLFNSVPVSRRSLDRKFIAAIGHSVVEEITRVHLRRAQWLLSTTLMPIQEVAQKSGFADARHLFVVFRRKLGMSPTAFRSGAVASGNVG